MKRIIQYWLNIVFKNIAAVVGREFYGRDSHPYELYLHYIEGNRGESIYFQGNGENGCVFPYYTDICWLPDNC